MTNLGKLIEQENENIAGLRKEYDNVQRMLKNAKERLDGHLLELNKDNLKSMEWLIKNPNLPGAYQATEELFKEYYGGTFKGPHPSGYIHDEDYNPIQLNVEFSLTDYNNGANKETFIENCKRFVKDYLQFFEPYEEIESRYSEKFPSMKVVGFQFGLLEEDGLSYLGYNPENEKWYCYNMFYRMVDTVCEFKDFADAIEFAYVKSNIEDEDDYE